LVFALEKSKQSNAYQTGSAVKKSNTDNGSKSKVSTGAITNKSTKNISHAVDSDNDDDLMNFLFKINK
jgi:hypothetical protein